MIREIVFRADPYQDQRSDRDPRLPRIALKLTTAEGLQVALPQSPIEPKSLSNEDD